MATKDMSVEALRNLAGAYLEPETLAKIHAARKERVAEARAITGPVDRPRELSPVEAERVHVLLREAEELRRLEEETAPRVARAKEMQSFRPAEGGASSTTLRCYAGEGLAGEGVVVHRAFGEFFTKALGGSFLDAGGALVPDEAAREIFAALTAEAVAFRAGIRRIQARGVPFRLPRLTSDPSATWTSEGEAIPEAAITSGQVVATPHKLAARVTISNELLSDAVTQPALTDLLFQRLVSSLSLALDLAVFEGTGSEYQPRGFRDRPDIGSISIGTNGAAFTSLDPFAEALRMIESANGRASAIVMHPRTWGDLLKLKETTSSIRPVLIEAAGSPSEAPQRSIFGVPVLLSSQLSTSETQGSATNATSAYLFDARAAFVVTWPQTPAGIGDRFFASDDAIRLDLDSSRLFNSDQSELRAILRADVAVVRPEVIVRIKGITPAA